jgi:hypothetical protein
VPDFWLSCGYRLLTIGADGRLAITDDFLRASLLRPELAPIPDSSARRARTARKVDSPHLVPRSLPTRLRRSPTRTHARTTTYGCGTGNGCSRRPTLEAAYVALFREGVDVAPILVHHLTEILLRHILGDAADPIEARVAEMLFARRRSR